MNRLTNLMAGAALLSIAAGAPAQNEAGNTSLVASATLTETTDATSPLRAGEYAIKLTRPMTVGQRMHVHGEGSEVRRVTSMTKEAERPVEASNISVTFDAEAEIREVDTKGRPVRVAYRINTCTMNIDGNGSVIAGPNTRITARRDGTKTSFDMDGRALSPTAANALGIVLSLDTMEATDDELMGSKPRSIGESWMIDVGKTTKEFKRFAGPVIEGAEIWGVSTLVERQEHKGRPCLLIQSQITAENIVPAMGGIPAGMDLKNATHTKMTQRLLPEDVRIPSLSDFVRTDVNLTFAPKPGAGATRMRIDGFRMAEIETTPLTRSTDASSSESESDSGNEQSSAPTSAVTEAGTEASESHPD